MSPLLHFTNEIVAATWRASLLIALIFALRPLIVRWLPLKILPWLWLVAAIKLLLISAPAGWWSIYNLTAFTHFFHPGPALHHIGSLPAVIAASETSPLSPSTTTIGQTWNWTQLLSLGWLLGVVLLAAVQAAAYISFHRQLVREEKLSGSRWQRLLDECAALVGVKAPLLIETHAIGSPAVIGLFRPQLLVPYGLLDHLEPEEARLVFIHELSHLRRRDLWLLILFASTRTLHWFNPLVWLAERALRTDCEAACDADVLRLTSGISENYGRALLRLTQLSSPRGVSVLVAAISTSSNQTQRRLQMIMKYQKPARWMGVTALAIVAGISVLTLPNEVAAQESTPATNPASDSKPSSLFQKYKGIAFSADFNNATLEEALNYLHLETKRLDPDHNGITFIVQPEALKAAKPITLTLNNVRLGQMLESVTQLSNTAFLDGADSIKIIPSVEKDPSSVAQPDDESGQATARKLQAMVIDKVNFDKLDVAMVLQFLASESQMLAPDKKGINFVLGKFEGKDHVHRPVTILLENVPMTDVLGYVEQQTNLKYSIKGNVVTLLPAQ